MEWLTGGEAIVGQLRRHGIEVVFGLPGAQIYSLFDALARETAIRVVGARHEQACGYMAFGYARASGRPGVYAVVPGPGVLNTGAALLTALGGNEPVLCLTGQVPSAFLGKGRGHLHEMPDQLATLRSITKWAARADTAEQAPFQVARAFQEMRSLRPGPAAIEMPWEQFAASADIDLLDPLPLAPDPVATGRVEAAAKTIAEARSPMIFVGSGSIEAADEVLELAEFLGAPVVSFRTGRGIVSDRHPLGFTIAEAYRLWPSTDCVIGIGTRLEVPHWRWPPSAAPRKTVRIEISAAELRRSPGDADLLGRAGPTIRALLDELRRTSGVKDGGRRSALAEAKESMRREIMAVEPHYGFLQAIRDVLPDDGVLTDELCQTGFASWYAFPVYKPRTFLSSGYQGTLGSGFPTALGAKVARPNVPVVSIAGDGGFMFAVQELATAVQYGIDVVAIVFNNNAFGNVRRDQETRFDGRVVAADLVNPDFMKLAESFGVAGARARNPDELRQHLEAAFGRGGPWLIEVPLDHKAERSPWPFIHPR